MTLSAAEGPPEETYRFVLVPLASCVDEALQQDLDLGNYGDEELDMLTNGDELEDENYRKMPVENIDNFEVTRAQFFSQKFVSFSKVFRSNKARICGGNQISEIYLNRA